MVAQEHGYVGSLHDLLQQIHAAGAPINHIPKDVQMVGVGKMNFFQHLRKEVPFPVEVRHAVDHRLAPVPNRVTEFYHTLQRNTRQLALRKTKEGWKAEKLAFCGA